MHTNLNGRTYTVETSHFNPSTIPIKGETAYARFFPSDLFYFVDFGEEKRKERKEIRRRFFSLSSLLSIYFIREF